MPASQPQVPLGADQSDDSRPLPAGVHHVVTLQGHSGPIDRIAWSPDGRWIASPSTDGTVRLWNADTGACERVILRPPDSGTPWIVAFSPTGGLLAVGHKGSSVTIWDPATGKQRDRLHNGPRAARRGVHSNAVIFASSGRLFISNSAHSSIWDPAQREFRRKWQSKRRYPNQASLTAHPVLDVVAMADRGETLTVVNSDGDRIASVARNYPYTAAFSPNDNLLAVENGSVIEVWSTDADARRCPTRWAPSTRRGH